MITDGTSFQVSQKVMREAWFRNSNLKAVTFCRWAVLTAGNENTLSVESMNTKAHPLTWSINACGECTNIEAFSFGEDSRQSWASVALALYEKAILLASFPSYRTCLWCSAKWISLSDLNLKVLCNNKGSLILFLK